MTIGCSNLTDEADYLDRPNMADGIKLIGDARDVPLNLGMLVITWNACETSLCEILCVIGSGNDWRRRNLVEALVVELSSVGIAQALNCYADDFPEEFIDLSESLRFASVFLERCRAYRNYYVHGINAITRYGILPSDEDLERDAPLSEVMKEGPYGKIWVKSAKHKRKHTFAFVTADDLMMINNHLAEFKEFLSELQISLIHYFRRLDYRNTAPLPSRPTLPIPLTKPDWMQKMLKPQRSLNLSRLNLQVDEEEEDLDD